MHKLLVAALVSILGFAAYSAHTHASSVARSVTPEQSSAIETAVRAFAQNVAQDVTREGPTAWHKSLEDSPAFFMAVDGAMAFPNSAAAKAGVDAFAATIQHIELTWGDDLRVDVLAPNLAVVAARYHELQIFKSGKRVDEHGFFTGTAENRDGRWQFRNAHWSEPLAPPAGK
jgi:hypothetical protein